MTKLTIQFQIHDDLTNTENLLYNFIRIHKDKKLAIQHARLFAARSWVNRSYQTLLQRGYFTEHAHYHPLTNDLIITLTPRIFPDTPHPPLPPYKLTDGRASRQL